MSHKNKSAQPDFNDKDIKDSDRTKSEHGDKSDKDDHSGGCHCN